jgi:Fe-S-cluster-containing hydrogenase component 2
MSVCPRDVLEPDVEGKPECVHIDACINCGLCSILCPDFAIGWTADPLSREQADAPRLNRGEIVTGDGKVTVKRIKRD